MWWLLFCERGPCYLRGRLGAHLLFAEMGSMREAAALLLLLLLRQPADTSRVRVLQEHVGVPIRVGFLGILF